jgi:hypothetical protein
MLLGGLRASARQTLADGRNSSGAREQTQGHALAFISVIV